MKKLVLALTLAATFAGQNSLASAATPAVKAIKVLPAKPFLTTTLSGAAGDQLVAFVTTPISIVSVGTVESSTAVTGVTSGNSDGFIQSVDYQGAVQWSLHLGGAGDEIATAIVKDKAGGYLVVGAASAAPLAPKPQVNDTGVVINPDGVNLEPMTSPLNSLTQLMLWRVSVTGQLVATSSLDAKAVIDPTAILATATGLLVTGGLIAGEGATGFSSSINPVYQFGPLVTTTKLPPKPLASITSIKAGTMIYKSYLSDGPIKGIPTWKPKSEIPVVIGYNKLAAVKSANYLQGKVLGAQWQSGKGLVILTERSDGFGLTII